MESDSEGDVVVPPAQVRRGEKRKRQEEDDGYLTGDELEVLAVQDKVPGGSMKNVYDCLWSQARQVGLEEGCKVAANLFNDTVYKYDAAAGTPLAPDRRRLLSRKMTASAMQRLADELIHTRDGAEAAISLKMRTIYEAMTHIEQNGLWRQSDPYEPVRMSERESRHYNRLLDQWLKLKRERDVEVARREKLEYEKPSIKVVMDPSSFRRLGRDG